MKTAQALALGIAVALGTALGEPLALPAQDLLGRLAPAPDLPAAVVRIDTTPAEAAAAARRAGARSVRMALPEGHPLLDGVAPEGLDLRADARGRLRWDGDRRLPLPEALPGLLRVDAAQLGAGAPAGLLRGRDVVLGWADPAMGPGATAPGVDGVLPRAEVAAIALGAARADAGLTAPPLPLAAALTGLLTAWFALRARRLTPDRALRRGALLAALMVTVALGARTLGLAAPLLGLVAAALGPAVIRLFTAASRALDTLDHVSLALEQEAAPAARDFIDPIAARLAASDAGLSALAARRQLTDALSRERMALFGIFDLQGALLIGTGALTRHAGERPALLDALAGLSPLPRDDLAARLHDHVARNAPLSLPSRQLGHQVLLTPVGEPGRAGALLLQRIAPPPLPHAPRRPLPPAMEDDPARRLSSP
ncbi:MAG: hypothetical protein H6739_12935 [Alphaproteobacteria bacterium]|nr:hypothetical protein [Alphaproteobacteria bacterium]